MEIKIANKKIGDGNPCFVIAEMSANHLQDFERAKLIIKTAAQCKVDAVKLQISTPDELTIDCRPSDAVALALRMGVPIFCNEELLCKPFADEHQSTEMGVDIGGNLMTFNIETKIK